MTRRYTLERKHFDAARRHPARFNSSSRYGDELALVPSGFARSAVARRRLMVPGRPPDQAQQCRQALISRGAPTCTVKGSARTT